MNKRILVIDPSRTIQTLLRIYFGNAGHQVLMYPTPQKALELLVSLHDAPDIIFLAVDKKKEAYKVIEYVKGKEKYAATRLVAMVLQEEKTEIQRDLSGSNICYLVKPFAIQDAVVLVSTPLERV